MSKLVADNEAVKKKEVADKLKLDDTVTVVYETGMFESISNFIRNKGKVDRTIEGQPQAFKTS